MIGLTGDRVRFKKRDLIRWVEHHLPLPIYLQDPLQPDAILTGLIPQLMAGDLGIVFEAIEAKDAWKGYWNVFSRQGFPNVYRVYFPKHKRKLVVYETEIDICDLSHLTK